VKKLLDLSFQTIKIYGLYQPPKTLNAADPSIPFLPEETASGGGVSVSVNVTGLASGMVLGNEAVTGDANVTASGVFSLMALGNESVAAEARVSPSGVSSALVLGSVSVTGEARVSPSGLATLTALGQVTVIAENPNVSVNVTGVASAVILGEETVQGEARVELSGVSSATALGQVSVVAESPNVTVLVTGVSTRAVLGQVEVAGAAVVAVADLDGVGIFRSKRKAKALAKLAAEERGALTGEAVAYMPEVVVAGALEASEQARGLRAVAQAAFAPCVVRAAVLGFEKCDLAGEVAVNDPDLQSILLMLEAA